MRMLLNFAKQNIRTGWQIALSSNRNLSTIAAISPARKSQISLFNNGTMNNSLQVLPVNTGLFQQIRHSNSFFSRKTGAEIWKGLLSVSNAGRRRGRGRGAGKRTYKDLNKGQKIGLGENNFLWPGLNTSPIQSGEIVKQKKLDNDPAYKEKLYEMRDKGDKRGRIWVHPLERGWTGTKLLGKWLGPPDPVAGEIFQGFDTKVLVVKPIFYMKPNFGRTKKVSVLTVTGNRNGLVGYAVTKSKDSRTAINNSKNKAGQRLFSVELERNGDTATVLHDFHSRFGSTNVYVEKKPAGFGLNAHRSIRSICHVVGITDLKATIEGAERNYLNITRAFLLGLINQKNFQVMANEKLLNVVEFNEALQGYPVVKARPQTGKVRKDHHIGRDEILDFKIYVHDGQVIQPEVLKPMYYTKDKGWRNYMKVWNYRKAREDVKIGLMAKYGQLDSYLTIRERQRLMDKRAQLAQENPKEEEA